MAYHQAPQHDLPGVTVSSPGYSHDTHYRAPGVYDTSYTHHPKPPAGYGFPRDDTGRALPSYKPPQLRWFFLGIVVLVILGYVALTEYALQVLPRESGRGEISSYTELEGRLGAEVSAALTSETSSIVVETPAPPVDIAARAAQFETIPSPPSDDSPDDSDSNTPDSVPESDTTDVPPDTPKTSPPATPKTTPPATPSEPPDKNRPGNTIIYVPPDDNTLSTVISTMPPSSYATLDNTLEIPDGVPTVVDGKTTTVAPGPTWVRPGVATVTDEDGVKTVTSTPEPFSTPTVITSVDDQGRATTRTTKVLAAPSTTVETDVNGIPTATQTLYPSAPDSSRTLVFSLKPHDYFIGFFLPTLLAVLLAIPIRTLNLTAQLYHPFHELTHTAGVPAKNSLLLRTGGIAGAKAALRSLFKGEPLLALTSLLLACSALLIPLSSEAVALKLYDVDGSCTPTSVRGCIMALSVFAIPARALVALLALMAVLTCCVMFSLRRWVSGVAGSPWSVAGTAALCGSTGLRGLISALPAGAKDKEIQDALRGRRFRLGYFTGRDGELEYGVLVDDLGAPRPVPFPAGNLAHKKKGRLGKKVPFFMLSVAGRVLFMAFIVALLAVILYYNNTGGDTGFERFMNQQTFGVRFLFTSVGVIISFAWASLFDAVALLSPYHLLSKHPQPARAILASPPTNPLSALPSSLRRRDPLLALAALTSLLSEFLPILLTNVPFRPTQTWVTHRACTWAAVGVLCLMLLVVLGSFWVRWPRMVVDPGTVAGGMYYVVDSRVVDELSGMGALGGKERDGRVESMGRMYEFGEVWGVSGERRVGVDVVERISS